MTSSRLSLLELGHVRVVVVEGAVAGAAGRERRPGDGRGVLLVELGDLDAAGDQVGDDDVVLEALALEELQLGGRVQDHLDVVVAGVLGQVQAERLEDGPVGAQRGAHLDQLRVEDGLRLLRVAGSGGYGEQAGGDGSGGEGSGKGGAGTSEASGHRVLLGVGG